MFLRAVNILKNAGDGNSYRDIIYVNVMGQREKVKGKQNQAGCKQVNALYSL
jgi:hypothetical protein